MSLFADRLLHQTAVVTVDDVQRLVANDLGVPVERIGILTRVYGSSPSVGPGEVRFDIHVKPEKTDGDV